MQVRNLKIQTLFSTQGNCYKFQLRNSKSKTLFPTRVRNSKSKHYFQLEEIAANFSYKIQNHRRYLNVSRNIIT